MNIYIFVLLVSFSFQLNAQYCIPTHDDNSDVFIHNFNLGDIVNRNSDTESGGYIFYEQITTALEIGRTYPLTASGKKIAGLSGDFGVWIDFDDNAVFTVNECVYQGPNSESISAMIEIPNNPSILGEKRMRVANIWATSYLNPCLDYSNGETEDYIVNFVDTPIIKNYCNCLPLKNILL